MKKIIASLALSAALGTGFAAGAQAQTVQGNGGTYQLTVTPNGGVLGGDTTHPTDYLYTYEVTLTQDTSGTQVTQFSINNIKGYVSGTAGVVDGSRPPFTPATTTDFGSNPIIVTTSGSGVTGISFSAASNGLVTAGAVPASFPFVFPGEGDTAQFGFDSTLPPTAKVSLSSNGQNADPNVGGGNLAGTGAAIGPGKATPTIPETSSFALLGLGLLPLGMLARRRIARNS